MAEKAAKDYVVSIHYTLTDDEDEVVDSSEGNDPLSYLHGYGEIVVGLEKAIEGKVAGEKFSVTITPEDGYGEYDEELVAEVAKDQLPDGAPCEVGEIFEVSGPDGVPVMAAITEVRDDVVVMDANHPLAGHTLFFDIEVVGLRKATADELKHGHAHGADGHEGHEH